MFVVIHITLAAASAALFLLLFFLLKHFQSHPKPPQQANGHLNISGRVTSSKQLFNWSDHPTLVTDAIENGWSRFAFTEYVSSSSTRSNRFLLGSCVAGDVNDVENDVETSWEVCPGSADSMQKIRLNSGPMNNIKTTSSVIKSALPLPGPTLGNLSPFPQEAYFEITILSGCENEGGSDVNVKGRVKSGEGENIKLIQEHGLDERDLHVNVEELRGRSCTNDIVEGYVMMSVGLTGGGSLPVKLPGSYPGSVGFNSDGSIYLDGIKLVSESNIERWERSGKVIGCGYNPSQKKVFFTLDSKLIHEINCKEKEYETPLYPILAANGDVTVLVNFGQSIFKYAPANLQRTQNPCFIGPMANSMGYEDSKELFSMGIIDSQWLNQSTTRSGQHIGNANKGMAKDYDEASEGDLFEIVIESNGYKKSPINILSQKDRS